MKNCIFCHRPIVDSEYVEIYIGGFDWEEQDEYRHGSLTALVPVFVLEDIGEEAEHACKPCIEALRGVRAGGRAV